MRRSVSAAVIGASLALVLAGCATASSPAAPSVASSTTGPPTSTASYIPYSPTPLPIDTGAPTAMSAAATPSAAPSPTQTPPTTLVPAAQPPVAQNTATNITSVTSPVNPRSNATVGVTTGAGASCTITVTYNSGASTAAGLGPKSADSHGAVSWTWKVGSRTSPGTYAISVVCEPGASAQTQFTVS